MDILIAFIEPPPLPPDEFPYTGNIITKALSIPHTQKETNINLKKM